MATPITCFQWKKDCSDYLDHQLSQENQHNAEEHLKTCRSCLTRFEHYQTILKQIKERSFSTPPLPIKKRFPKAFQSILESSLLLSLLLGGHSLYLHYKNQPFPAQNPPPLPSQKSTDLPQPTFTEFSFTGIPTELWRFTIKTVHPNELRPKIIPILTQLGIQSSNPTTGIHVPGGIEFQFLLAKERIPTLHSSLEHLTTHIQKDWGSLDPQPLTWYKLDKPFSQNHLLQINHKIAQVMIWLAQSF